MAGMLQTAYN